MLAAAENSNPRAAIRWQRFYGKTALVDDVMKSVDIVSHFREARRTESRELASAHYELVYLGFFSREADRSGERSLRCK